MLRKRRTREHIIADLSVNHVERQVLLAGFTAQRQMPADYGYDLVVTTYNDRGEVESGLIFIQLKATDRLPLITSGREIAWRVQTADRELWRRELMPVILIVYDAQAEKAYWSCLQQSFRDRRLALNRPKQKTLTLHIPLSHRLDTPAVRLFAKWKQDVVRQGEGIVHHEFETHS